MGVRNQPSYRRNWRKHNGLSRCERRAIVDAANGLTAHEAAAVNGIGYETVKSQRYWAMSKLAAKTITHAVAIAWRQGIIGAADLTAGRASS